MKPETAKAIKDLGDLGTLIRQAHDEATKGVLAKRPAGYFSVKEYVGAMKIPEATARGQLGALMRAGKYETVKAYEDSGDGRVRIMTFYRKVAK